MPGGVAAGVGAAVVAGVVAGAGAVLVRGLPALWSAARSSALQWPPGPTIITATTTPKGRILITAAAAGCGTAITGRAPATKQIGCAFPQTSPVARRRSS